MAIVSKPSTDPFQYLEGGREGVRKRFGEQLRQRLQDLPETTISEFCQLSGYSVSEFDNFRAGNFSNIDAQGLRILSVSFGIRPEEFIGFCASAEDKSKLVAAISEQERQIIVVAYQTEREEPYDPSATISREQLIHGYLFRRLVERF